MQKKFPVLLVMIGFERVKNIHAQHKPGLAMQKNFTNTQHLKKYGGFVSISMGQKK